MKKFTKFLSLLSAAVIAVTASSFTVSAAEEWSEPLVSFPSYDYFEDGSHLLWKDGSKSCFDNGRIYWSLSRSRAIAVKPADGVSIDDLRELMEKHDFKEMSFYMIPEPLEGCLIISANSAESLNKTASAASEWYEDGLITAAKFYGCYTSMQSSHQDYPDMAECVVERSHKVEDIELPVNITFEDVEAEPDAFDPEPEPEPEPGVPATPYEAEKFYEENGEAGVIPGGKNGCGKAVIVLPCVNNDNCQYDVYGRTGGEYEIESRKRYVSNYLTGYDVFVISLGSVRDINIPVYEFNMPLMYNNIKYYSINLRFELGDNGMYKVSEAPTAPQQVSIFAEKYGNIKASGDTVITAFRQVGAFESFECSNVNNFVSPDSTYCVSMESLDYQKENGEIVPDMTVGGGDCVIRTYNLRKNGTYGFKYLSSQKYNSNSPTAYGPSTIYTYSLTKTDKDISVSENSKAEYDVIKYGDANLDSNVNIYDAILVARYVLNNNILSSNEIWAADINHDGIVNIYDAVNIAKTLLKTSDK